MKWFLLLGLFAISPAKADWFGPDNFDDCILESMKGINSNSAANIIYRSCKNKFPVKKDEPVEQDKKVVEYVDPIVESEFKSFSRCFFIYSSLIENAENLRLPNLQYSIRDRMLWLDGYLKATKRNKTFNKVFNSSLKSNKAVGLEVEIDLKNSLKEKRSQLFNRAISKAITCDAILSIQGVALPTFLDITNSTNT